MSVTEPERHELYQAFEGLMGKKKAETMMALLPPTGWGDVATKQDLELLESRLREQILRTALTINIPSILAAVGLSFAATRLG
jgi:hypothetical protein